MASTQIPELINITRVAIQETTIHIVGDTPLIVHAWSNKAKAMMLDTQTKATKTKDKPKRNPMDDFIQSLYWLTDKPSKSTQSAFDTVAETAKWGFPLTAIKQAANSAAYRLGWVKNQMELRGSYFLKTEWGDMFEIQGNIPEMREDMVRISNGSADLRYRGEFKNWHADITVQYNASGRLTLEQIVNCIDAGGRTCGIGEWRPEKDGDFGRFHVEMGFVIKGQ